MYNIFEECKKSSLQHATYTAFAANEMTYGEAWKKIQARAAAMQARGIKKGDVVAILSKNSPEWCVTFFAITSLGALALVLDTNLIPEMYRTMLKHVDTKEVYVSEEFMADDYGVNKYSIEENDPVKSFELQEKVDGDDIAALLYTSGTTGNPKVVPLTHNNLLKTSYNSVNHIGGIVPGDIYMSILPLFHVYGIIAGFFAPYLNGCTTIFQTSLKGPDILATLAKYPVSVFSAVPQMWELFFDRLLKKVKGDSKLKYLIFKMFLKYAPDFRHIGLGFLVDKIFHPVHKTFGLRLRYLLSGGSRFGVHYSVAYANMGFKVIEGYGLTETTGPVCGSNTKKPMPGTVGKPMPGNFVEIRNAPEGDKRGEVWIKGVSVMPGYYKNPEATKEAFDENGWFNSGDIGFIDKQGELHITGRKKNVIVLPSGKNAYPEDLEFFYKASPLVAELTVFGRRVEGKDAIYAVVVPTYKTRDCYTQIKNEFKKMHSGLPFYRIISDFAISYDALPRTSTKKVQNHKVIESLNNGMYQVSADDPNFVVKEITAATPEAERVIDALKKLLKVDVFYANQTLGDFEVDSMRYIELIATLEKKLKIRINPSQFMTTPTIEALIDVLVASPSSSGQDLEKDILEGKITTRVYSFYNPFIELCLLLVRIYSKVFWKLHLKNREKLEINNDIIIANHQSYLDILWLLCMLPYRKRRNVCIAGKRELWPLKLIFWGIHVIYVDRTGNYIPSLKEAADILRMGKSLIIFPEGTRSYDGKIGEFKNGVAYLAKNLHKKIIPIFIKGAHEVFPRKKWLPRLIAAKNSVLSVRDKIDPDKFATIEDLNNEMKKLLQA